MLDTKLSKPSLKVTYKEWDLIMSRNVTPVVRDLQSDLTLVDNIVFSFILLYTMLLHRILYNPTHTHISCPPPIRRNNLNVKQVPSWSGPQSPLLWEIWPVVLLSSCHCSVRHTWKQKNDVQFGPNHNICTSLLFTFSLSRRRRNVNFRWVFLWVVITVIKNARETPGEPGLRCSLTCCIINTELMSYFMWRWKKGP